MKIAFIICTTLTLIGLVFKIQHWPGGGLFTAFGFLALSITMFISGLKMLFRKEARPFSGIEQMIVSFMLIGLMFKLQHWPGAGPILVVMGSTLSILYLGATWLFLQTDQIRPKVPNVGGILLGSSYSVLLIGIVFATQHWPGARVQLLVGLTSAPIFLVLNWVLIDRKSIPLGLKVESAIRFLALQTWGLILFFFGSPL